VLIRQLALELDAGQVSKNEASRLLRQISLTSERALNLTTNLTKVARLEDGLFELEPINPVQACEDVAIELRPLYRETNRTISVRRLYHAPLAVANRDLLRQVLVNFADNALHYSVASQPVEMTVEVSRRGNRVRLGVRDYGPAIEADVKLRHTRPRSSGLGLLIARRFAETMNGSVGVIRHQDGATFYIDIGVSSQLSLL
ncbi:MAG: HAMP domain-containing sensor histidine kinase, partial [Candidatus Saccharimonadaceae bacterium]